VTSLKTKDIKLNMLEAHTSGSRTTSGKLIVKLEKKKKNKTLTLQTQAHSCERYVIHIKKTLEPDSQTDKSGVWRKTMRGYKLPLDRRFSVKYRSTQVLLSFKKRLDVWIQMVKELSLTLLLCWLLFFFFPFCLHGCRVVAGCTCRWWFFVLGASGKGEHAAVCLDPVLR
jgi:hypothetical protein